MPTYAYNCPDCGFERDIVQKITAQPIDTCPECKSKNFRRGPGGGQGLIFKGSGFYITDYARKSKKGEKQEGDS